MKESQGTGFRVFSVKKNCQEARALSYIQDRHEFLKIGERRRADGA